MIAALAVAALAGLAFWVYLNRIAREMETVSIDVASASDSRLIPESLYSVAVTDTDVRYTHPDGTQEIVEWTDLQAVDVQTTDQGPFLPDVFWVLTLPRGAVTKFTKPINTFSYNTL